MTANFTMISIFLSALLAFSQMANAVQKTIQPPIPNHIETINRTIANLPGINTAAIGIIKNGELTWAGYYGEHRPGTPASPITQFNVGSITKTVTTETVLKLVSQGKLDLDEPMATYWVDPDIENDARHKRLTPRMALTHTTGFQNWRFYNEDFKLKFNSDPGTKYEYSGEGFEYLSKYVERKLGQDFETLVVENIFKPLDIKNASLSARKDNFKNIAVSKTATGETPGFYCYPGGKYCSKEGQYSTAGNMVISLEGYFKFLSSVMKSSNYSTEITLDRNTVQITRPVRYCESGTPKCPTAQGYGLGWVVVDLEDDKILWHGGSDWSLVTSAYFYEGSQDGLIIFLNAPNQYAMTAMPVLLKVLDPESPIVDQYEHWATRN